MPEYQAPGVYVEEVERGSKSIEGVSTSTAGFLGPTERGPTYPQYVTSFSEFRRLFGGPVEYSNLAYAVEGFFNNGGGRAYVGRIVPKAWRSETGTTASTTVDGDDGSTTETHEFLTVGPGAWGTNVAVDITDSSLGADGTFKLRVGYWTEDLSDHTDRDYSNDVATEANQGLVEFIGPPAIEEVYDNVSIDEGSANFVEGRLGNSNLVEATQNDRVRPENGTSVLGASYEFGNNVSSADVGLSDFEGHDRSVSGDTVRKRTGLMAFREIDDISIVCVPDDYDHDGLREAVKTHCGTHTGDRIAVLNSGPNDDPSAVETTAGEIDSSYAALYYPWLNVFDPDTNNETSVPPCGHIAGIYARSDGQHGVHKAPANEVVNGINSLTLTVTRDDQKRLNPKGVNCIRTFRGRGTRVWGARTLSSDPSWKYVNVRRLMLYLEESIDEGTQWVVFESNDEQTWARVRQTVRNFLTNVWNDGALMGSTPEEAFYVKCDRSTMTQDDIDNGRLICEIGVAPVKPAEFVIFRIGQWTGGVEGGE